MKPKGIEMKERPILFSAPMVQAILAGRKTMTRRVVKFPKDFDGREVYQNGTLGLKYSKADSTLWRIFCPYGEIGDRLWVRETFFINRRKPNTISEIRYMADTGGYYCEGGKMLQEYYEKKPSIFMPRAASRITLEITNVRVERLQEITDEDIAREGTSDWTLEESQHLTEDGKAVIRGHFHILWTTINGKGSWNANPWVWVIEFKRRTDK